MSARPTWRRSAFIARKAWQSRLVLAVLSRFGSVFADFRQTPPHAIKLPPHEEQVAESETSVKSCALFLASPR